MIDMSTYWPIAIILGAGTFLIRYSFILIMDRISVPQSIERMLRFIPAAVLPALIAPAILLQRIGGDISFAGWAKPAAALVAIAVAWKTRNIFATIGSGMTTLWILQAII